ncbi:selenocysteine lyase [Desulfitobacterium dichloroeliminans LMG P-21439]|uniref:Selenocysteine lyase n=1 Tax=Desulfitobacterium dichloroeliminans (strain LMG P-21439 / DCA1) TaxID=871963 RepID=L0F2R6_DESDL|nr:aminotransferase class V-fold PLP-dependent enzyme [Desulfitobacterium dichloroeliminans]AGA68124.1 selenocysteine lyase [Desulfitobacterium dichloroeliminans LMG P-21439]
MNFRFFPFAQRMNYGHLFLGLDTQVPLASGSSITGINFDNGATTPPLRSVMEEINRFAPMYGSVHRGAGYKSVVSSQIYEQARTEVLKFVGGDPRTDVVIFVKNASEALNKLANRLYHKHKREVVLTTWMEHHSNLLPWREKFSVDYIEVDEQGRLRLDDLVAKLERYQGAVKLVTVTGASNVTGHRNPIYKIAELAHRYGAKICVDGAQLVPHAPVDMRPSHSPEHIDFLAFSAHKMYAPFGTGVLIGPRAFFEQGAPDYSGGGTAQLVTPDRIIWEDAPHKEEAGTPNLMGVVALVAAIRTLSALGMKKVLQHEEELLGYAYERLRWMDGLTFYGGIPLNQQQLSQRIGVIPFNVEGLFHEDVAELLAREGGIAVRNGCFCAQPYVQRLLHISKQEMEQHMANPSLPHPGMVRVSLGLYNTKEEIDVFIDILGRIVSTRSRSLRSAKMGY